jgi:hypothetical protein
MLLQVIYLNPKPIIFKVKSNDNIKYSLNIKSLKVNSKFNNNHQFAFIYVI